MASGLDEACLDARGDACADIRVVPAVISGQFRWQVQMPSVSINVDTSGNQWQSVGAVQMQAADRACRR